MPHGPVIYLPARCNTCGHRVPKAPFIGDLDCAMMSQRKCPECQSAMYRDDEDEEEQDITDSCWNYGENADRESHD